MTTTLGKGIEVFLFQYFLWKRFISKFDQCGTDLLLPTPLPKDYEILCYEITKCN